MGTRWVRLGTYQIFFFEKKNWVRLGAAWVRLDMARVWVLCKTTSFSIFFFFLFSKTTTEAEKTEPSLALFRFHSQIVSDPTPLPTFTHQPPPAHHSTAPPLVSTAMAALLIPAAMLLFTAAAKLLIIQQQRRSSSSQQQRRSSSQRWLRRPSQRRQRWPSQQHFPLLLLSCIRGTYILLLLLLQFCDFYFCFCSIYCATDLLEMELFQKNENI